MMHQEIIQRCKECGSFWDNTICMKTKLTICRSCCDNECTSHFSCWGRYY